MVSRRASWIRMYYLCVGARRGAVRRLTVSGETSFGEMIGCMFFGGFILESGVGGGY